MSSLHFSAPFHKLYILYSELLFSQSLPEDVTNKLCADFQHVAFSHVEDRLKNALDYVDHENIPVSSLIVVGGVAANSELRRYVAGILIVFEAQCFCIFSATTILPHPRYLILLKQLFFFCLFALS